MFGVTALLLRVNGHTAVLGGTRDVNCFETLGSDAALEAEHSPAGMLRRHLAAPRSVPVGVEIVLTKGLGCSGAVRIIGLSVTALDACKPPTPVDPSVTFLIEHQGIPQKRGNGRKASERRLSSDSRQKCRTLAALHSAGK